MEYIPFLAQLTSIEESGWSTIDCTSSTGQRHSDPLTHFANMYVCDIFTPEIGSVYDDSAIPT